MENKTYNRRRFLQRGLTALAGLTLTGSAAYLAKGYAKEGYVWQIDPKKCIQCEKCETNCVLSVSAVKCVHTVQICGYCDLCGGYFQQNAKNLNTGAENQLCHTGAIKRSFVEDPYFEYHIDEELCNGCGKCVKGCSSFGNGSMYLQIRQNKCVQCNDCAIAQVCPSGAISRIPAYQAYLLKQG